MDTAHLYLELLECGDCVMQALAAERKAGNAIRRHSCDAAARWRVTRREVERAAEYYVLALRRFRAAVVSDFLPTAAEARPSVRRAGGSKSREKSPSTRAKTAFAARGASKYN
jgi:hypothetical protein